MQSPNLGATAIIPVVRCKQFNAITVLHVGIFFMRDRRCDWGNTVDIDELEWSDRMAKWTRRACHLSLRRWVIYTPFHNLHFRLFHGLAMFCISVIQMLYCRLTKNIKCDHVIATKSCRENRLREYEKYRKRSTWN